MAKIFLGVGLAGLIVALALLVYEVRRVPDAPPTKERKTDVVVRPRGATPDDILRNRPGSKAPEGPTKVIPIPPERQLKPVKRILPKDVEDPRRPSRFTKTLAKPPANPVPPNPFKPPPIRVNPYRSKGPAY